MCSSACVGGLGFQRDRHLLLLLGKHRLEQAVSCKSLSRLKKKQHYLPVCESIGESQRHEERKREKRKKIRLADTVLIFKLCWKNLNMNKNTDVRSSEMFQKLTQFPVVYIACFFFLHDYFQPQ